MIRRLCLAAVLVAAASGAARPAVAAPGPALVWADAEGLWMSAAGDGSGAVKLPIVTAPQANGSQPVALDPAGALVATTDAAGDLLVTPVAGGLSRTLLPRCVAGRLGWSRPGHLVAACQKGGVDVDPSTGTVTRLRGVATEAPEGLSPDGQLVAAVDLDHDFLRITDATTGALARAVRLPTSDADDADASWSPDGRTILVVEDLPDAPGPDVSDVLLVDLPSGHVTRVVPPEPGNLRLTSWAPDGRSAVLVEELVGSDGSSNGNELVRVGPGLPMTVVPTGDDADSLGSGALGGGPGLDLGPPPAPIMRAAARASGPGQITVTAALPADSAGAVVTDVTGRRLGRVFGAPLALTGLHPSTTYRLTLTPVGWSGETAAASQVSARTGPVPAVTVSVRAPARVGAGNRYRVTVTVRRADTGHTLAGRVVALSDGGRVVLRGRTNHFGSASFTLTMHDTTALSAIEAGDRHAGAARSAAVAVEAGETVRVLAEVADGRTELVTLQILPAGRDFQVQVTTRPPITRYLESGRPFTLRVPRPTRGTAHYTVQAEDWSTTPPGLDGTSTVIAVR